MNLEWSSRQPRAAAPSMWPGKVVTPRHPGPSTPAIAATIWLWPCSLAGIAPQQSTLCLRAVDKLTDASDTRLSSTVILNKLAQMLEDQPHPGEEPDER